MYRWDEVHVHTRRLSGFVIAILLLDFSSMPMIWGKYEVLYLFMKSLLWFSYSSAFCYSRTSYVNLPLPSLGFIILFASWWCYCSNSMYGFLCSKDVIYFSRHLIFIYLYLISLASLTRVFSLGSDRVCFRLGASLYLAVLLEFLSIGVYWFIYLECWVVYILLTDVCILVVVIPLMYGICIVMWCIIVNVMYMLYICSVMIIFLVLLCFVLIDPKPPIALYYLSVRYVNPLSRKGNSIYRRIQQLDKIKL